MPENPFLKYRTRLDSYNRAIATGWDDDRFVTLVEEIDAAISAVDGHGFLMTPFASYPDLSPSGGHLYVKDETGNVGGSHKSRHLFGVALALAVDRPDVTDDAELAIASCGNAAIAASVIARAIGRRLRVFIPTWADQAIVQTLRDNHAIIEVCDRRPDEAGDPTYLRFIEAIADGSVPFSVQSTATPTTLDGGRTIGWELADQLLEAGVDGVVDIFAQVGGGALASAAWLGLTDSRVTESNVRPVLYPVQTHACAPLARAWEALLATGLPRGQLARHARQHPERFMWPWETIGDSSATGILDDVTYDWLLIVDGMLTSGGHPIVTDEFTVTNAHVDGRAITGIDVEPTGTAGYAGLLTHSISDSAVVLFTGVTRR